MKALPRSSLNTRGLVNSRMPTPGIGEPSQGEPGPPGERPCANLIESRDGDSQLFECVDAASLGAQALATEQVGSGELGSGGHSGQAVEP